MNWWPAYGTAANENVYLLVAMASKWYFLHFYRAMHFSAKRGIAIACRLSVRLSVCNVGEL